jgi:hypothetical protein
VWDFLVLIGLTVALIATMSFTAVMGLVVLGQKIYEWKKGRSEQGWDTTQTEVYGDQLDDLMDQKNAFATNFLLTSGCILDFEEDDGTMVKLTGMEAVERLKQFYAEGTRIDVTNRGDCKEVGPWLEKMLNPGAPKRLK